MYLAVFVRVLLSLVSSFARLLITTTSYAQFVSYACFRAPFLFFVLLVRTSVDACFAIKVARPNSRPVNGGLSQLRGLSQAVAEARSSPQGRQVPHHSCPCLLLDRAPSQLLIAVVFLRTRPLSSASCCTHSQRFASDRGGVWLRKGLVVSSRACLYNTVLGLFVHKVLVCRFASRWFDTICSSL